MPSSNKKKIILEKCYNNNNNNNNSFDEIGIDEAGRGPLFGRVYSASVILPKNNDFKFELLKDSKKFTSKKKLLEVYEYIKENAICYSYSWENEDFIDKNNILSTTHICMHKCINDILNKMNIIYGHKDITKNYNEKYMLLVDGNNFKPYAKFDNIAMKYKSVPHFCVEGGDNKYCAIAAASILAKVERDRYIEELCKENPELDENYGLLNNKGYGTKKHIDGIKEHGITKWHRKSYGICSRY